MAEQKSRLVIELDSTQALKNAKEMTKELVAMRKAGDLAAKSLKEVVKSNNPRLNKSKPYLSEKSTLDKFIISIYKSTEELAKTYDETKAKASLLPALYERWSLQNQFEIQRKTARNTRDNTIDQAYERDPKTDEYLKTKSERHGLIEKAKTEYSHTLNQIQKQLDRNVEELIAKQNVESIASASSILDQINSIVKLYEGESSKTYRIIRDVERATKLSGAIAGGYASQVSTKIKTQQAQDQLQSEVDVKLATASGERDSAVKKAHEQDPENQDYLNDPYVRMQMELAAEENYQRQVYLIREKAAIDNKVLKDKEFSDNLLSYGSMFGQMAEMVKEYSGESSGAYKVMFGMQQAFSIASSISAANLAYVQAFANPSKMSFGEKIMGGMAVMSALLPALSTIATTTLGFAQGGYTGAGRKYDLAGFVHKGEVVFSQEDVARWGGPAQVEAIRTGSSGSKPMLERQRLIAIRESNDLSKQPKVTIINQTSQPIEATSDWYGDELKIILHEMRKQNETMMDAKIEKRFRMANRQGW